MTSNAFLLHRGSVSLAKEEEEEESTYNYCSYLDKSTLPLRRKKIDVVELIFTTRNQSQYQLNIFFLN